MGYKRKRKVYDLDFTGTDDEGLQVRMGGLTVDQYLRITGADESSGDDEEWMVSVFAEKLQSWNLEEPDGTPVPTTEAAVRAEDFTFIVRLIDAWTDAIGGVSAPLEQSSPGGVPSPEVSIPMAPLSGSPQPLPEQSGSWGSAVPSTFSRASS